MNPEDLDLAIAIARAGALHALEGFRVGATVEKKGAIDLVTQYDREVERIVRERLASTFRGDAVVGEEEDPTPGSARVWYLDPIDGTTNFAHGHPFFCTSLGLFEGDEPLLGVVVAPALGVVWAAARGQGATRNGVPCRLGHADTLADALVATGFSYDRFETSDDNLAEHDAFVKCTRGVRRCGAAALDLAMTADGTYDAFWEQGLRAWDVAAGMVLVREAGGLVTDYRGAPTRPEAGQVVAGHARIHDAVLATIAGARRGRGLSVGGRRRDVVASEA